MPRKITRIHHHQAKRQHVYHVEGIGHLTITDPQSPYSGEPHKIELAECEDAATPSTPTGEAEGDGDETIRSYSGTDP